ncbi:hypothetical protein HDU93_006944 [Gonapodya sp. JEL0774]|nr:hypothetical protein HDU93_006944 [Gonapodya sp. JEL0774]
MSPSATIHPLDAPPAPLQEPSPAPFLYTPNLSLSQKFTYLRAVQPDAQYFPSAPDGDGAIHPVVVDLLQDPELLPIQHTWIFEGSTSSAPNEMPRFYFRKDNRSSRNRTVYVCCASLSPKDVLAALYTQDVATHLRPSDWSTFDAEDAKRRATEPRPLLDIHGAGYFTEFYGGSIATFVDMILGFGNAGILIQSNAARTLTLNVTYKNGVPLNGVVRFHAGVSRIEGRKSWPYCNLYTDKKAEEDARPLIMSDGLFVAPKNSYIAPVGMEVDMGPEERQARRTGKPAEKL